jgi:hypothetical protein
MIGNVGYSSCGRKPKQLLGASEDDRMSGELIVVVCRPRSFPLYFLSAGRMRAYGRSNRDPLS